MVHWLWTVDAPLFISTRRLERNKTLKPVLNSYAIDSGGFSELSIYGEWQTSVGEYTERIKRYREGLGEPDFIAQQDWMCEDFILKKTGLSVKEHQTRTVDNFLELSGHADNIIPVIQGFTKNEYIDCIEMFLKAGVDLANYPTVGLGSICRRQSMDEVVEIVKYITSYGIKLHGFGVKQVGLKNMGHLLKSADSMAWSFNARHEKPLPDCTHNNCASCIEYALNWYNKIINLN